MRVYLDNGIPYREWRCQQIRWQADELEQAYWRAKAEAAQKMLDFPEPRLSSRRLWSPRDDYGMKGWRGKVVSIA